MEWFVGVPLVLMALVCPLMMLGFMVWGWLTARGRGGKAGGHAGHGAHGMMMCHGSHGGQDKRSDEANLVDASLSSKENDQQS